ncbi:MAG: glutamate--tRNA ligase [Alphaproteobacteria bacterium]
MTVVTRFPPSPTGFMHIGTARTALFNWLYARKHGGKMLFRIEDTDRARHNEEAVTALIEALKWLKIDYDGEIVSQFANRDRHAAVAQELLAKGQAYHCYCSPEELDTMREKAKAEGKPTFYDRRWREPTQAPPAGIEPVIRIKAPLDGSSRVHDAVQGDVTVNNEQLDDFIILRSDGTPTYMLSVVVDDHDMGVTHVIRGDDHLNNTFRQNVIYTAMGWDIPTYAHLPLILGPDGSKMSKRHGAASVEEYKDMGYLPAALRNYLLRLGWSHGDDEIISDAEAREWFTLEGCNKAAARFDFAKLENLNAHYMKQLSADELIALALPFYQKRHNIQPDAAALARIKSGIAELQNRATTLLQFTDESVFYAKSIPFDYDEKARELLNGSSPVLNGLCTGFEECADTDFTPERIKDICQSVAADLADGKMGKVGMPLRAAITGTSVSPSIFEACSILGKAEALTRLKAAIDWLARHDTMAKSA